MEIRQTLATNQKIIMLNGINTAIANSVQNHQKLEQILKQPIANVYNSTDGFWIDLWKSFSGLLNNQAGIREEFEASHQLELSIRRSLKDQQNIKIFAHSQGSIIVRNVLSKLAEENFSFKTIKVYTFGAANYIWPKGLQVFSFINQNDYLARTLSFLTKQFNSFLYQPINELKNELIIEKNYQELEYQEGLLINNKTANPIQAHEWTSYLDNFKK